MEIAVLNPKSLKMLTGVTTTQPILLRLILGTKIVVVR